MLSPRGMETVKNILGGVRVCVCTADASQDDSAVG